MTAYPTGTVAFLFTDIEGSTRRWETRQQAMWDAVERHFALLHEAISAHNGVLFKTVGDAVQAAFPTGPDAIGAAIDGQRALHRADWGDLGPLRVRMAIHVGAATPRDGDYLAPALNRLARVLSAGYGDQVLLTEAAVAVAAPALSGGVDVIDLGAHRLRDLLQAEHIYQLRGPGLAAEFPPLKSLDRLLNNLPAQPTPLIGRETELAAARDLLQQDGVRLVTLTGPGGTGKTRLGIQTGADLIDSFPDGVWFVPLAAIADPELVVPAIAQPLGVREVPDEPLLETLKGYLQSRQALLLLDNFEHVTPAAADVASLLAACPKLKVLATSREPLRIAAERELPVPPLSLPTSRQARHLDPVELLEFSAIRLFVERAQNVKLDFALAEANAADVAAICLRLDGLPLAIELAAARVRILPPAQLLSRLDNRLKLLTGGNRDLPARQQTLRAAIEWSHDLLSTADQALFARLAAFSGGFTLEGAESVGNLAGWPLLDVFDGLDSLTQKNLVRREQDAAAMPRFALLETIREFALERLETSEEAEQVRHAHAWYFLATAKQAEQELSGRQHVAWLDRLESDHDNFRAALGWLEIQDDPTSFLELAWAMWQFWWIRGHLTEGRGWLERAVGLGFGAPAVVRARALSGAGVFAESQGDYERATVLHEQALAIRRDLGDAAAVSDSLTNLGIIARLRGRHAEATRLLGQALDHWSAADAEAETIVPLHELGLVALDQGDFETARRLLDDAQELSRRYGDLAALGQATESLGSLAFHQQDFARAARLFEESLAISRELEDPRLTARSLVNLGEVEQEHGNLVQAESNYREALMHFRELADMRGAAFALGQLAKAALARRNTQEARAFAAESLTLRRTVGEASAIIDSLEVLAAIACQEGYAIRCARLFGATDAMRLVGATPPPESYQGDREAFIASARLALGDSRFSEAWEAGRMLSVEQSLTEALDGCADATAMTTRR